MMQTENSGSQNDDLKGSDAVAGYEDDEIVSGQ
jgi:hypothetical protein